MQLGTLSTSSRSAVEAYDLRMAPNAAVVLSVLGNIHVRTRDEHLRKVTKIRMSRSHIVGVLEECLRFAFCE